MAKKKGKRGKKALAAQKKREKEERKKASQGIQQSYRQVTGQLFSKPTDQDVKIGAFSLAAYGQDLIADTCIEITIGRRYGLIGRNGSGKSTFLKCLAAREVPIPEHIDIFFLDEEAAPEDKSALTCVVELATKKIAELEKQADEVLEEMGADCPLLMDIYERLDDLEPSTAEARAGELLHGLGFTKTMMNRPTKDMSGGWRMRVSLARALFMKPTLLLLDEPTNHLDLEACVWLEQHLATYDRCLIMVSHSQDFMNGVCTHIIHITPKRTLKNYTGNYDGFIKTKQENEVNQMKAYQKEQDDIKHLKKFISSCGTYSNLVKQAKSKQKILDKMEAAGLTEKVHEEHKIRFRFPDPGKLPPPLINFSKVSFSYSGKPEDYLYTNLDVGCDQDSRIALVGPNGAGKSTLLKLMLGELEPSEGDVKRNLKTRVGKYHQHSTDQLDETKTVLEFMMEKFPAKKWEIEDWRKHVGRYGITGRNQTCKMSTLSDGIKSRIVFSLLALETPHLLLLDEPTNHLDIECIDSLADAINNFNGGLLLVSHDFRLIDQVAKEIWVCDKKTVVRWNGGIRDYKKSLLKNFTTITRAQN